MSKLFVDLHVHTTASDGSLTPSEIIQLAARQQLDVIAITDHDTISGLASALQAGEEYHIAVIAGLEIGVDWQGEEIHLLGYGIDTTNPVLNIALDNLLVERNHRNQQVIDKLNILGLSMTLDEVIQAAGGKVISRNHFARVLLAKGYVTSLQQAFNLYLADGQPCFMPRSNPSPAQGIAWIQQAGGIAVLAHPWLIRKTAPLEVIKALLPLGLAGVEAWYPKHSTEQVNALLSLAQNHELVVTGGSDFHGDGKAESALGFPWQNEKLLASKLRGCNHLWMGKADEHET